MKEFLNKFSDRNSLLFDENTSKTKTLSQKIIDSISGILNDSSSSIDREYLGEYGVFHPEKTGKISYGMFLEFIKFVKIDDKVDYIDFITQRAILDLKSGRLNEESLNNLYFCLKNGFLTKSDFQKSLEYYFVLNKNISYNTPSDFLNLDQISNEYTALISLLSGINGAVPKLKKYENNKFIEFILKNKAYYKEKIPKYIDFIYEQLKNGNFDFYKEIILLYSVEESD